MPPWSRSLGLVLLGTIGLVLIALGTWRSISLDHDPSMVIVVGAGLLLLSMIGPRLENLKFGAGGVELSLTARLKSAGAPALAHTVATSNLEIPKLVAAYEIAHRELRDDRKGRIKIQDRLVVRAAELAEKETLKRTELKRAFRAGDEASRVLILGFMMGDTSLVSYDVLSEAIGRPLSRNEQYQALKLLYRGDHGLKPAQVRALIDEADRSSLTINPGSNRADMLSELRQRWGGSSTNSV